MENIIQQLQSLGSQLGREKAGSRDVPSRSRKARNEAGSYRIADGGHDDGDGLGRLPCGVGRLGSRRQDDVDVSLGEVGSQSGQSIGLPVCISKLKPNIPPIRPPSLLQRHCERGDASLRLQVALDVWQEEA